MIPVARTENLLIQELDNELIVYDQERDICHCLNPLAARVWHYCDGQNTVEDIAQFLTEELEISADTDIRGLVWLTLDELESLHLMKQYLGTPIVSTPTISRRKVIKRATLVGGFALGTLFPMVRSITSPALADMASGRPGKQPGTSNPISNSASNPPSNNLRANSIADGTGTGLLTGVPAKGGCRFSPHPTNASLNRCGKGSCRGICQPIKDQNGIVQGCQCI